MYLQFSKLFAPPDESGSGSTSPTGASGTSQEMNKEDVIEFLGSDDEDEEVLELPEKKVKLDKGDEPDDETEELKELEEEIKEPTEEQLELTTPIKRREILSKYPNLFKDFPYLEKAYYREQQFTELLPTIEDAKTAVGKAQVLDQFEKDVINGGNTENILRAVREENPNSFHKLVDNYLPTLAKVDEQAYLHVIGNVAKHTIVAMIQEANRSKNEPLRLAAQILNQFVFASSDFTPPTNLSKQTDNQPDPVNERERQFTQRQFNSTLGDLNTKVNNTLKNTIDAHIDPRGSMSDYVRKNASRDALGSLNELIGQDTRFKALADKLWEKAVQDDFSKESTDRIKSAYLAKAKTLLPTVIKKARSEALRTGSKSDNDNSTHKKSPITPGRPRSQSNSGGKITKAADIPKGMSTLEFLNED